MSIDSGSRGLVGLPEGVHSMSRYPELVNTRGTKAHVEILSRARDRVYREQLMLCESMLLHRARRSEIVRRLDMSRKRAAKRIDYTNA